MIGATKAIKALIIATAAVASMTLPAYSQQFNKGSGGRSPYPVDDRPKVDERLTNPRSSAYRNPTRNTILGVLRARA